MIYDPEANLLSWQLAKDPVSHAKEFGNFIIHLSKTGKPVIIEILEASKFIGQVGKVKNVKNLQQAVQLN